MATGLDRSMVRDVCSPVINTSAVELSEKGGEDQVAHPSGTGPLFSMGVLKRTLISPSEIKSCMLPKGRPEMSIFLVAARYAALGFDIACGQGFVGITLAA